MYIVSRAYTSSVSKEPRVPRESRVSRDPRDPRETRAREPRDPRESREPRNPRVTRVIGKPRVPRESRVPREPRLPREPTQTREEEDDTEGLESEETTCYDCDLCQQSFGSKVDLKAHEEGLVHVLTENAGNVGVEPKKRPIEQACPTSDKRDAEGQQSDYEMLSDTTSIGKSV